MSKFKNLQNVNLVEKRKTWFSIPLGILLVTLIFGVIYGFVFGSPLNLSMDFTGGYSLTVTIGPSLTDDSQEAYETQINDVFETLSNSNGTAYGLVVEGFTRQGEGADAGLYVRYRGVDGFSDSQMEDVNEELEQALLTTLFTSINDKYAGSVTRGSSVSATVSSELLINAICAILLAVVLMLIYIAIRFELLSGISSIICLTHDLLIMVAFMLIFRIPVSSTFIAALITVLGYSINNTIIIFDRVRDVLKTSDGNRMTYAQVANESIKSTMVRSINTTATTFITVFMVTIFSLIFAVYDMVYFCLPLMVGILAGTFSSILLAPSIWTFWKERQAKKDVKYPEPKLPDGPTAADAAQPPMTTSTDNTTV